MKQLVKYLKGYEKECVLGPLFKLIEATFDLLVPLAIAAIIDNGIGKADGSYIVKMSFVLLMLAVLGLTFSITAQYFCAKAAVGFSEKLRHSLFEHILSFSHKEIDQVGSSTLITRLTSDVNQVQSAVNMTLRLFLRSPFIVFGAMIMAFFVDVKAALVFVVIIPLLSVVVFGIMLITMPLFKKVQSHLDEILGKTRENLSGVRVIRAFNMDESETDSFLTENETLTSMQNLVGKISALTNPLTYIIVNVGIIAVIWIGGKRVYSGTLMQGQVVALVSYMSQILVELIKLANLIITITKALASANRLSWVFEVESSLEAKRENEDKSSMRENNYEEEEDFSMRKNDYSEDEDKFIEFRDVSLNYNESEEDALSDISFSVKKGQTIGIIGGTGSGKTSLISLIPRFYDATGGEVIIEGENVKNIPLTKLREQVGIALQKAVLFSGTIAENLRLGNENATDDELMKAVEIAQAVDVVNSKDKGLESYIEEGGKNLSGGQKQRLTIARALVKNPKILILDDSSSALDYATDSRLRKAIKDLNGQMTVFIVSQRTSSVANADKIIVLDDGKIVGMGKHDELLDACSVYKEIYDSQYKNVSGVDHE